MSEERTLQQRSVQIKKEQITSWAHWIISPVRLNDFFASFPLKEFLILPMQ